MLALQVTFQLSGVIEVVSIMLSIIALIVTVVGFFASLKFYRDGVVLQGKANDALTKIEERTQFIQSQVGGMFDKTLDAAIGKTEALSASFEQVNEQLELTKTRIVEESLTQIGAAGEKERKRLAQIVDAQIELIREKVQNAKESAQDMNEDLRFAPLVLGEEVVLSKLSVAKNGLRTWEVARGVQDMSTSRALYFLSRLKTRGLVFKEGERYFLTREGWDHEGIDDA